VRGAARVPLERVASFASSAKESSS
jgi:hypothetical protein